MKFRNEEEARAWDLYAAARLAYSAEYCFLTSQQAASHADEMLAYRRKRDRDFCDKCGRATLSVSTIGKLHCEVCSGPKEFP